MQYPMTASIQRQPRRQGMVWMDTLIGLSLIIALTAVLAATHAQHRKTGKAMAERREAVRVLEREAERVRSRDAIQHEDIDQQLLEGGWVKLSKPLSRGEAELFVFRSLPNTVSTAAEGLP
ncbi:MAG: hypothetical protein AAGF84_14965 [Planctomycetota bacterium]